MVEPTDHSLAECAFAVVRRGLTAEGRADEFGLPTFPSRRFVTAGRVTVRTRGLLEYELVDIEGPEGPEGSEGPDGSEGSEGSEGSDDKRARAIAITLLRSTGMLSRLGMAYRPFPAGPLTPVAGLQMVGKVIEAHYALQIDCADPYALVDDVFLPLELVNRQAEGLGIREGRRSV